MAAMRENLYLEVTDACMHACLTCPHGSHRAAGQPYFTPVEEACATAARAMAEQGVRSVTLSGGEPLTHPDIAALCARLREMGLHITLLSNLQLLTERNLGEALRAAAPDMTVVTALHSMDAGPHDAVTRHPGSHAAALRAIDELQRLRMDTVIKVILSLRTCERLDDILSGAFRRWGRGVRFNLCGMDLCGADAEAVAQTPVDYRREGPLICAALDGAEQRYGGELPRFLTISEYPLCFLDPYFWKLTRRGSARMTAYIGGAGLQTAEALRAESTCAPHAAACAACAARPLCPGLWHSVYRLQGEGCVRPWRAKNQED